MTASFLFFAILIGVVGRMAEAELHRRRSSTARGTCSAWRSSSGSRAASRSIMNNGLITDTVLNCGRAGGRRPGWRRVHQPDVRACSCRCRSSSRRHRVWRRWRCRSWRRWRASPTCRPQLVVTAYQSANGLVNLVTPTSAVVMGGLAIARVGIRHLAQFVWPVLILLAILTVAVLTISVAPVDELTAIHGALTIGEGMTDDRRSHRRPSRRRDWHALTPEAALERQGVTVEHGLTAGRGRDARAPSTVRTSSPSRPRSRAGRRSCASTATRCRSCCWRPASLSLFLPGQVATGVVLIGLTLFNAAMGLNQEGKADGERRRAPEDDGRQGQGPARRRARRAADGGARARATSSTSRPATSSRPTARILHRGHARDRRVRADRRERPGPQAGRGRRGGRRRSATGSTSRS